MNKFLLALGSTGFKILLLLTAFATSVILVFGNSAVVKQSLKDSGIYSAFVDNIIESAQQEATRGGDSGDLDLSQPGIKDAVQKSFSPSVLQSSAEQFIDGTYRWLDGTVATPDFKIDLTGVKASLATNLGDFGATRFTSLPACTVQQIQQIGTDIDPLTIPCRPPGITTDRVRQEVTRQINSGDGFIKDTVITADTLAKDNPDGNPFEKAKQVPQIFAWAQKAGWIAGILAVIVGMALIFLRRDRREGVRTVGMSLLGTGIFVGLGTLLVTFIFNQANKPGGRLDSLSTDNQAFQSALISVIQSITNAFNRYLLLFAIGYALLGAILLLALRFIKKRRSAAAERTVIEGHPAHQPVADTSTTAETTHTATPTDSPESEPTGPPPLKKK